MLANYLIGLREGLEASLVVGILIAYLVKTENRDKLKHVWLGVGLALALSIGFFIGADSISASMSFKAQEVFGGVMSIIAVCFVTWMIFWMRRTARNIKGDLHGKLDKAISFGGPAVVLTAFIAVAREGLETALFLWAAAQSTGSGSTPIVGASLGLLTAVVLGYLFYRGALKINLATFFTWTGAALIVIAAGVFAYAIHDLQEGGVLPGLTDHAFDATSVIPPTSWYGTLLKGIFNISAAPSILETIAWLAYLIPMMILFFRKPKPKVSTSVPSAPAAATSPPATVTVADASAPATSPSPSPNAGGASSGTSS